MKHLDRSHHQPRGLRSLLRPGPRPWFHRPRPATPEGHHGAEVGPAPSAASDFDFDFDFEQLVALHRRALQLRDRAIAETHVGEDALSLGDEIKATQHFSFGSHYRRRADELEAAIERVMATLRHSAAGARLAAEALRAAREELYGTAEAPTRPEFA